jgi:hypothetical protein
MYTLKFPRLDHAHFIHYYLVHEEKVIHLQAKLEHGRPLILVNPSDMYDLLTASCEVFFVPNLSELVFEFGDLPGQRYDVDLVSATWKPRSIYFI